MRDRNRRKLIIYGLLISLFVTTVAYAAISTTLDIVGNVSRKGGLWNIYFANLSEPELTGDASSAEARINSTTFNFGANLYQPGDSVTYTLDVKNGGTINAKLSSISVQAPDNLEERNLVYLITYSDGTEIVSGDSLKPGDSKTIKVVLKFKDSATSLPSTDTISNFSFTLVYVQDITEQTTPGGNVAPGITSNNVIAQIYGNSVQNGTPSPDNPVEIQSVGDKTENLFDVNDFMETYQPYVTVPIVFTTFEGEEVLRMYGAVNATGRAVQYLKGEFKEKTAYTFSLDCYDVFSTTNGLHGVHFRIYYTDSTYVEFVGTNRVDQAWKHHSYTSNPSKTVAYVALSYATGGAYSYFKNIQIKEGGAETQYEPYGKYKIPITVSNGSTSKTTNIYLDEPLRKIGDYADTLDLEKGAVVRRVGKRVLNVSDKWGLPGTLIDGYSSYRLVGFFPTTEALPFLSNYFKTIPGVYYNLYKENLATSFPNSNQLIINISNDLANSNSQTTVENWKTWLNGKNVYVLYPLIETTAETVSVPEIPELSGNVSYSIGTSVQPSAINYGTRN